MRSCVSPHFAVSLCTVRVEYAVRDRRAALSLSLSLNTVYLHAPIPTPPARRPPPSRRFKLQRCGTRPATTTAHRRRALRSVSVERILEILYVRCCVCVPASILLPTRSHVLPHRSARRDERRVAVLLDHSCIVEMNIFDHLNDSNHLNRNSPVIRLNDSVFSVFSVRHLIFFLSLDESFFF